MRSFWESIQNPNVSGVALMQANIVDTFRSMSLRIQIAQNWSYLHILGPKVDIIYPLGSLGCSAQAATSDCGLVRLSAAELRWLHSGDRPTRSIVSLVQLTSFLQQRFHWETFGGVERKGFHESSMFSYPRP